MPKRFWEIDAARGFAVVLMVLFNYAFALRYFGLYNIAQTDLFWFWFPRFVGAMFIFIAGISFWLSRSKARSDKSFYWKNTKRGLMIFGLGMLITIATLFFVPQQPVWFGILHLIGASIIIAPAFLRIKHAIPGLILGLLLIATGIFLQSASFDIPLLLWLGFQPRSFATLDYFPLLPWSGFFVLGMAFGKHFYKGGKRNFALLQQNTLLSFFQLLGRNSLVIYLAHIPVLIAFLILTGFPVSL